MPALEIEPGVVITENPPILQYLADRAPQAGLAPAAGTLERARLQEWLNFTSSELHKAFSPWFSGRTLEGDDKVRIEANLARRIGTVERGLSDGRPYILGHSFSVADAYLFVVLNWANFIGRDLTAWPNVAAYVARVAARPAVHKALAAEGLIQSETPFLHRTMAEYVPVVTARQSPASRNDLRRDHIDAIELAGENTAFARVRCSIGSRDFVDFLLLVRVEGRWQVISKVFQIIERRS